MKRMLLFILIMGMGSAYSQSEGRDIRHLTLIEPESPVPVIVIGTEASASVQFAADELKTHLEQITGRKLMIQLDGDFKGESSYIAVGPGTLTAGIDTSNLGIEQYIIDVAPSGLAIVGASRPPILGKYARDRGTLYGVYDFLEQLGVRWYRPEPWGNHLPKKNTIEIPLGRKVHPEPHYEMRSGVGGGFCRYRPTTLAQRDRLTLWAVRNRLNWSEASDDPKYGGRVFFTFHHAYDQLIPPEEYFDKHPEYYAMVDGKRTVADKLKPYPHFQLCLGNPELQETFAQEVLRLIENKPYLDSISVEPNDSGKTWCECSLCKAMDDPENPNVMSNRVCKFNNMVARKVAEKYPDKRLHWLAYSAHTAVPTRVDALEPNTIIQMATINEWGNYSQKLLDDSASWNKRFLEALRGWSELKPSCIMTYEYWSGYGWPGPFPVTRMIADRIRNYRQFKVRGIYCEGHGHWGPQGLTKYMFAKLIWNPELDLDKELDLFYRNYYGPAAKPLKSYHEALMDAFEKQRPSVFSGGRGMHLIFTPGLISELEGYVKKARAAVQGNSLYERRLEGVLVGYEIGRRVCDILQTKKTDSEASIVQTGRGSYLKSKKTARKLKDLKSYILSFADSEDVVIDVRLSDPQGAGMSYLEKDILENAAFFYLHEDRLLEDF
jgi:hypothetical protein